MGMDDSWPDSGSNRMMMIDHGTKTSDSCDGIKCEGIYIYLYIYNCMTKLVDFHQKFVG